MALAGRAALSPHGRHRNDASLVVVQHFRQHGANRAHRTHKIDIQHAHPVRVGDILEQLLVGDACIADHGIDRAEPCLPFRDRKFHCRGILLIGQKRQCAGLPSEPVRRFPAFAVSKRGIPSVFGKRAHTGGTDAARASGDENSLRHVRWQPSAVPRTDTGSDPCSVPDLPQCRYR